MRRVVFSGGTHCGKTTLIEHYRSLGYPTVPEPGMTFIGELVASMGLEEYRAWRADNQQEFFNRLVERQVELESTLPPEGTYVFLDRSMMDTVAMCRHVGVKVPELAVERARAFRYDDVFICDLLPDFDNRAHTGRVFTREDSENIARLVHEAYDEFGYSPIHLPPISVEERLATINQQIGLN